MCVPAYEGPHCQNLTTWEGMVTLCLDGKAVEGVKMKTRGHVSEMFPKHQFSLTLPRAISMLGMAPDRKWVLAMSFIDTTYQRNPTGFDLYGAMGGWAPSVRFVNLRWHDVDYGLYYVGELPEVSENRIRLPPPRPDEEEAAYLLTADWNQSGVFAIQTPETSTFFNVRYPPISQVSAGQLSRLKHLLDEVDRRALERSVSGPSGLEEILDFPSFARYYILQELVKDTDGYAFSNFMKVEAGKLFHAAPWDFDLAFHFDCTGKYYTNIFTGEVSPGVQGWNVENDRSMGYWTGPDGYGDGIWSFGSNKRQLFTNIWRHPRFAAAFATAWRAARQGPLTDAVLQTMVRKRTAEIDAAAMRDMGIWRHSQRCGFWDCCSLADSKDFRLASMDLEKYLLNRAHWIDERVGEWRVV